MKVKDKLLHLAPKKEWHALTSRYCVYNIKALHLFLSKNSNVQYSVPSGHSFSKHSGPPLSEGFTSVDSTNGRLKIFKEKCSVVADVYYVLRPTVVVAVLNTYRLFLLVFIPQTIQYDK